jgi:hypothetical protein
MTAMGMAVALTICAGPRAAAGGSVTETIIRACQVGS